MFSLTFDKQDEDDQVPHDIELYINSKNDQNLTQSDFDINDVRLQMAIQTQIKKRNIVIGDLINLSTECLYKSSEVI